MRPDTQIIRAGYHPGAEHPDCAPAIHLASTYAQAAPGEPYTHAYARIGNPNRNALEAALAELEGGTRGFAFASGMAAIQAACMAILKPGDKVLACLDIYGGSRRFFEGILKPWGVAVEYADAQDTPAVAKALQAGPQLLWLESIGNPMMSVPDLAELGGLAHQAGAKVAVDNTFPSPVFCKPFNFGADLVVHSTTKYLAGHSDSLGGAVLVRDDAAASALQRWQWSTGGVLSPFDSWLTLRSLRTLHLRMARHHANALALAQALEGRPGVLAVHHPGLASHPRRELAARQASGLPGVFSLELAGGAEAAQRFFKALKLFTLAESLGGVESLVGWPQAMSHGSMPKEERERRGIRPGLVRLSCGIEDGQDLIEDALQALEASQAGA